MGSLYHGEGGGGGGGGGGCSFLQYLPSKPGKYGPKIFWCADAEKMYPLLDKPYLRKFGLTTQVNLGRKIALELCAPCLLLGTERKKKKKIGRVQLHKKMKQNKTHELGQTHTTTKKSKKNTRIFT